MQTAARHLLRDLRDLAADVAQPGEARLDRLLSGAAQLQHSGVIPVYCNIHLAEANHAYLSRRMMAP